MATENNFYGQNARWSTNGIVCTAFGVQSLIQSADAERQSAQSTYPNQMGNTAIATFYDYKTRLTVTFVPSQVAVANGDLYTSQYQPQVGSALVMQDTIDAANYINSTNFKVESVTERRTATGDAEVVCTLMAWDAIS